tara:strand:- start:4927 stop:5058 length:132 start_codon:yes stop_codon:yes gene_type:complete
MKIDITDELITITLPEAYKGHPIDIKNHSNLTVVIKTPNKEKA